MKKLLIILAVVGVILASSGYATAAMLWGCGSPDWGTGASGPSPVIFKFDTQTGVIITTLDFTSDNWMWISGIADSGEYLYASHNLYNVDSGSYMDQYDFKIAKVDRATGAVISDISIAGFLGQTYSQVNALDYHDGKLYAVENATSGSTIRGYAMEIVLDGNGDVSGATLGAYVGPYPDCGLDYHDGLWWATSWGYTPSHMEGSLVFTSPDIMNTAFTQVGTGNTAVEGIGMIDGWEYACGYLFAVTWYPVPASATAVYSIDTSTWTATYSLYDLASQLPAGITALDGLSEVASPPPDPFQSGADRLTALQNDDGGWDWPLDDGNPANASPPNTIGPIGMGLAQAYSQTADPVHLSALEDVGNLLLTKINTFSPSDGYLAAKLDQVFGVTTYTNHVKTYFYDKLAAGTYQRLGDSTLYSTATYVQRIRTIRSGSQANMAAWDIGMGLAGAASVGASTAEWIAGVEAEINELNGSGWYDVIGLAGAVYGLAYICEDFDPTAGEHAAASSLRDLADILASYQIAGGGFSWNSNYVIPQDLDEVIQETAYAVLALNEVDRAGYLAGIQGAADFLKCVQLNTGGWNGYTTDPQENNELTGEALWAIAAASVVDNAIQDGGDRLTALQNNDGGWDWPLDDGNPASTSPRNTIGPIGMGLAQAYSQTSDPDHLAALQDAGDLLLTKIYNFSPPDGYLAVQLDQIFGGTTYTDYVKTYFYDQLAAGTYDRNNLGTLYSTETYVQLIRNARAGSNLAAWDIGMGLVGAVSIGASTAEWIAGVEAEIDEFDDDLAWDVIGLAGAVYGLAFACEDYDPTAGAHAAASSLSDLAAILAGYQVSGGGFIDEVGNTVPDVQVTAYAILALNEVDRGGYLTAIQDAADYLECIQLGAGGWEELPGDGENNEVTAEALWGIVTADYGVDADADEDGICARLDNCLLIANPGQENDDADTLGNACDNCPDTDNESQADSDGDTLGDACDNCPAVANEDQIDTDLDTLGDVCDNCPEDANLDQADGDADTVGNVCDNCPAVVNAGQEDADFDDVGDVCDNCPVDSNAGQEDTDSDGIGDACNDANDADGDEWNDTLDNCPDIANADQDDEDSDGIGDACDGCPGLYSPVDSYPPQGNYIGDACDCEGDFRCDGDVDGTDASYFKFHFGRSVITQYPCTILDPCRGDFNCDGDVDGSDASLFKADFGRGAFGSSPCPPCVDTDWCAYLP